MERRSYLLLYYYKQWSPRITLYRIKLRNIELAAPYMQDGSLATLEDVLDHYSLHLKDSPNIDGILGARLTGTPIAFTQQEKDDLINYMKTLTDTSLINNPAFSNPW